VVVFCAPSRVLPVHPVRFSSRRRDGINPIGYGQALLREESERFEGQVFTFTG
jgi:hypothetical protein